MLKRDSIGRFFLRALPLLLLTMLVQSSDAQQSYRSYQQLSGQVLRNGQKPEKASASRGLPMRFKGWKHPGKYRSEYLKHFSRPRASVARAELLKNAARTAAHNNSASAQFASSALPGILLRPSLPTGYIPSAIASGDFNGDGNLDFVVANGGDNTLWLYFGNGNGTFQLPVIVPVTLGQSPVWIATGDLRGIGRTDLVVAEADSNSVGIFLNNGDGTFVESVVALSNMATCLAVGDFNGDGKLDIVAPMDDDNSNVYIAMLPGLGNGTFGSPVITPLDGYTPEIFWITTSDLNGDGLPDLVLTSNQQDIAVQVYLNNGNGTFAAGQVVNQNYTNYMLGTLLFDANGDGITDVMIADTYGALWVFFGKGDGTFDLTNYNLFGIGDVAYGLAAADVNGDGNMDVIGSGVFVNDLPAYGTEAGDQICVLLGDGKGNFSAPTVYRGDSSSYSLVVADFNGSGFPDAVTANQDNDSVSVFLNDGTGAFGAPDGNWVAYEGGGAVNAPMLLPGVVMADVDGNGTTDVTFMEWPPPGGTDNYYQLTVLLNDGSGNLSAPIRSDAATTLIGNYVLADFRNTGQPDFLGISQVYNSNGNYIAFVPNSGGGHFGPVKQVSSPNATGAIGVGDFNNDGNLDFVAAGPGINSDPNNLQGIQVYLGRGDGTFRTGYVQTFGGTSASRYPVAVYVGDFNRDGNLDLLVLLEGNSGYITNADLYEFLGNGDGTFQTGKVILPNIGPMTVADVDGDGYPDIVSMVSPIPSEIGIPTLSQFSIYIGQADGTFTLTNTYAPYNGSVIFPQEVTTTFTPLVADFNGDGIPDIAAFQQNGITYPDTYVQFLLGNGDGTFTPTYEVFDFRKPTLTVYAADLTGSGKAELFEFNGYRSTYNVLPSIVAPAFQFALLQDPLPGSQGNGIVVLDVPSASATTISLTASDPAITVPTTVTIPAGNISQTFSFTIGPAFNTSHVFAIYAQLGSTSATAYGTLLASAGFQAGAGGVTTWPNVDLGPGQTQELSAGVSSVNGYATTVSVQCLGLSPNAQCTVSPSTLILRSWDSATAGMTVTVAANTPQGSYPAKVQFTDGLFTQDVPFTLNVGDFSLSLSPQVLQVLATDQTGSYNLTVGSINSFDQVVTLGCGGSATGITCSTVPFTYPPTGSTPITVGVQTQTVPAGNYQITVTGTSTPITHTATAVLQVSDFTASVSPTSASVPQGGSTSFNITVSAVNGFAGTVSLACSSSAAVTCSFNPASVAVPAGGSGTSALTVTVPQSAADGNYPITISATSSQVTHTATVQMQVTADFTASLSPTSATVSAGGSANFNVGVTSESGFSGNVSLACSTSSPVTCSFKPNSLAVPANGSATSVLTVTASSQAAAATKLRTDRTPILALGVVLPIGAFFIVAKSRRRWVGFVVLVLALCGIPSCGSGSSGSGGGGGSQTYSITVQVSSGSSYTATAGTITLTVN